LQMVNGGYPVLICHSQHRMQVFHLPLIHLSGVSSTTRRPSGLLWGLGPLDVTDGEQVLLRLLPRCH
jgi:hypothetical protein